MFSMANVTCLMHIFENNLVALRYCRILYFCRLKISGYEETSVIDFNSRICKRLRFRADEKNHR